MTEHRDEANQRGTTITPGECPVCHRPVLATEHHGGVPRIYCSPEHRWLAGSRRKAGIPLDREPVNIPRRTSRRALPDFAVYAGQTLDRAVARIERLMTDDRLDANVDAVAAALTMYLGHAVSACAQALAKLDHHQEDDST